MNKLKNANGNKPLTQEQITDKMYMGEPWDVVVENAIMLEKEYEQKHS